LGESSGCDDYLVNCYSRNHRNTFFKIDLKKKNENGQIMIEGIFKETQGNLLEPAMHQPKIFAHMG